MLTKQEQYVIDLTTQLWNAFSKLPQDTVSGGHANDLAELSFLVHRIQDMLAARSTYRQMATERKKASSSEGSPTP